MTSNSNLAEVIHMADHVPSPQLDDGYTKIANELLEAIARLRISSIQFSVLMAVIRKTYGFNKKTDDIGLSQLVKMTGIDKANVSRAVRALAEMRILVRTIGKFGHNLSINKAYSQWGLLKLQPRPRVVESTTPPVVESTTPPVVESTTTKDNLPKDNLPKEKNLLRNRNCASASFDAFWSIWPNKKDRKRSRAVFEKINPDDELLKTILAAVAAQSATAGWIEDGGKFIPHPTTWLNGARWEDEVTPVLGSFNEQQQRFIDTFNENIGEVCQPVTEWSQKCSDLINIALAGKWGLDGWERYWRYVRDKCHFKGQMSFEWLVTRDNLVRVKRGDFEVEA